VTDHPSPVRRPGGRSARVRAAVLNATIEALLDRGFEFTIRDVARRAGVNETTIYRRWQTKEKLILDAVVSHLEEEVPVPDTGTLAGDLTALLEATRAVIASPRGTLLVRLVARGDAPDYDAMIRQFWAARVSVVEQILDRADQRGELRPGIDPQLVFELLVGPLDLRILLTREPLEPSLPARIVDLVINGIAITPLRSAAGGASAAD
jgi:AcrR family transcriptional regulator